MRKEINVVIGDDGGRDAGKTYALTEMAADRLQRWIVAAMCAANAANPSLDLDISAPAPVLLHSVVNALFKGDPNTVIALLDELMTCVKFRYSPENAHAVRAPLPNDIEEVLTRVHLQHEVFQLCTGFSLPGSPSK